MNQEQIATSKAPESTPINFDDCIRLNFHLPLRIHKRCDLHNGIRGANVSKVLTARASPESTGAYHLIEPSI